MTRSRSRHALGIDKNAATHQTNTVGAADIPSRDRPKRAQPAPFMSISTSGSTSASVTSESEYSTPTTSAVPTPAPDGSKSGKNSSEIHLPSRPVRTSLRQAIAKRKRDLESDDESDELQQALRRRTSNRWANKKFRTQTSKEDEDEDLLDASEKLARKLQAEEDSKIMRSSSSAVLLDRGLDINTEDELDQYYSDEDNISHNESVVDPASDSSDLSSPPSSPPRRIQSRKAGAKTKKVKSQKSAHAIIEESGVAYGPVLGNPSLKSREARDLAQLMKHHPQIISMWQKLRDIQTPKTGKIEQPSNITRQLKNFQLEGVAWMKAMEQSEWKGGLLGDEMGLGKTIQAVSLIMSDFPQKEPTLVLVPPVALMQWSSEIASYTDNSLKTFVLHVSNAKSKNITVKELKRYDVIMMSYNSLESMFRKQEKGIKRKDELHKQKSPIHQIKFHRVILDEAHCIKSRVTMTAKACFALKACYRWCLSGTPLQNRIGEFFSLVRFLGIRPFALYMCKKCPCESMEWDMTEGLSRCNSCQCASVEHMSLFNQQLLNPIQKYGRYGVGAQAFERLRLLSDRIMLRRQKKDHMNAMELPVKEVRVDRQFFGEEENDFANSIMTNSNRQFNTYVAQGVVLNNYANIFSLIMKMRQVADHPDLILKKSVEGGQNVIVCAICDETAEEAIRSKCRHDFCRECARRYINSTSSPDCPVCHIPLSIDLEQPELEQDEAFVKKSSIINRIKMENWTSSTKIELLVHELWKLRSSHASHKSIIFSQFTGMLQLIEWRLRRAGITTVMLDGSMSPVQRKASIDHFMNNINVECFLVSLRAGGVALNLTEASRVFIIDP